MYIGIVTEVQQNHKPVETARKGMEVCIKIMPTPGEAPKLYGRHFDHKDMLVSRVGSIIISGFFAFVLALLYSLLRLQFHNHPTTSNLTQLI